VSRGFAILLSMVLVLGGCHAPVGAELTPSISNFRSNSDECEASKQWPLWNGYVKRFIAEDGRVVDHTGGGHSTSEGQAYGLFLALVANDRPAFDKMLKWTEQNLASGSLAKNLPAWKWGQGESGQWKVLDENAASDADLWLAYALMEAGRLWKEPRYTKTARQVSANIVSKEIEKLPGFGYILLPGPSGFRIDESNWRLNPSYIPLQLVRAMDDANMPGPWGKIERNTLKMFGKISPNGYAADWVAYNPESGFVPDPVTGKIGSYDAIRVYLWAGMLHDDHPQKGVLGYQLRGMVRHWSQFGYVPRKVDPWSIGALSRHGTVGFLASILPEIHASKNTEMIGRLTRQIEQSRNGELYGTPPTYYDQNLILFAQGFVQGRYEFDPKGRLKTRWYDKCVNK
jgi:endoglucanase